MGSLSTNAPFFWSEKPSVLSGKPSVKVLGSRSVEVSWTQPALKASQATIISYAIRYWHTPTTKKVVMAESQDRSKTINGLEPCTDYQVDIASYSVVGPGTWSVAEKFRTRDERK